jgi:glycosyltransferase involved in cell wall biosynthesis
VEDPWRAYATAPTLRVAAYTDYVYRRDGGAIYAERAFALFLARVGEELDELVVVGRLDPAQGRWHYRLPDDVRFVALPHYERLSQALPVLLATARSLRIFARLLRRVDVVWLFGPHPLAFAFAVLAASAGRRVVLGVRQDLPRYTARRHPGRRGLRVAALALEHGFRALGRASRVVVVGPELARNYRRAGEVLEISVPLVRDRDVVPPSVAEGRRYDGRLQVLSVGRLDREKNPLLLADVLADLRARDERWRLVVCGDGPLRDPLASRLTALGVADHAELRGYVPLDAGLLALYRESHAVLHVSWTEGVPQILSEAFASRVPVVATAVGGVREAAADAALLVAPGDAAAAADALRRVAGDPELRRRLTAAGAAQVRERSLDAEARRVAAFLSAERGRRR